MFFEKSISKLSSFDFLLTVNLSINRKDIRYDMRSTPIFRYHFKRYKISHDFIEYLIYILRNINFFSKNINLALAKILKTIRFYK